MTLTKRYTLYLLLISVCHTQSHAAVIAQPPGTALTMISERALVVFDPLAGTQTLVVQHTFEGTSTPFGLIIPTPSPPHITTPSERIQRIIQNKLHPRGKIQRTLDLQLTSWVGGCAVRKVGEATTTTEKKHRTQNAAAQTTNLGNAPEPLHHWLLSNGFTIGPAQAAWLGQLRALGWTLTGIVVRPPHTKGTPPPVLRGPVLALTHTSDSPALAIAQPPFALDNTPSTVNLEVAVLTEWAVSLDQAEDLPPFFSDTISARTLSRMNSEAGSLPWAFRRDGTLTAWSLPRTSELGILRFVRVDPRPTLRPAPTPRVRAHRLYIPLELLLLFSAGLLWLWLRFGRRRLSPRHRRL